MPKYFLNLRYHRDLICDEAGSDLPDLEAARAEAIGAARALMANGMREGRLLSNGQFEITDNGGATVLVVRFTEVIA